MIAPVHVIGRYALYDPIATGGMATVHFGRLRGPVGFSRTVAIKRLHAQYARDPEFVAMFLEEARLAARISHPNVVAALDVVATEGELFLVLEYVQGESLARLARNRRVPPRIASSILCGALHGLHAAHEARDERGERLNIVHRDVSPQNILVGVDGTARVLDFGVAKASGRPQNTRDGHIKGKISYMAPEQVRGQISRRSDIYAAAIVLWEALTGERLFGGGDDVETLAKALAGTLVAPSSIVPDLPPGVDGVVMRGLAFDAADRFESAREMALELEKTAGIASPTEVGAWVACTAGDSLTQRSARMCEIEASSSPSLQVGAIPGDRSEAQTVAPPRRQAGGAAPIDSTGAPPRSTRRPAPAMKLDPITADGALSLPVRPMRERRRWIVPALLLLSAPLLLLMFFSLWRSTPPPQTPALAAPQPVPPPSGPSAAPPMASAPEEIASVGPAPSAPARPPVPEMRRAPPDPTGRSPKKLCTPPYTVDVDGTKHFKLECL